MSDGVSGRAVSCAPKLILGVGNLLLQDEGVGVRAVEALAQMKLPEGVELIDGGTAGIDLVYWLAGRRKVVVMDAILAGEAPGALVRLNVADLAAGSEERLSLHQIGLLDALDMTRFMPEGMPQEVVILGVQPAQMDWGVDLSPAVAAALDQLVQAALAEVAGPQA